MILINGDSGPHTSQMQSESEREFKKLRGEKQGAVSYSLIFSGFFILLLLRLLLPKIFRHPQARAIVNALKLDFIHKGAN